MLNFSEKQPKQAREKGKKDTKEDRIVEFFDKYDLDFKNGFYFFNKEMTTERQIKRLIYQSGFILPDQVNDILKIICDRGQCVNDLAPYKWYNANVDLELENEDIRILKMLEWYHNIPFREIFFDLVTKKSDRLYILWGQEGTGKSVFLNLVTKYIGMDYVISLTFNQLQGRFAMANVIGKKLICGDDMGDGETVKENSGLLKSIVTGNLISAEPKGKGNVNFFCEANFLFNSNLPPAINHLEQGNKRRFYIYHLKKKIDYDCVVGEWDWLPKTEDNTDLHKAFTEAVLKSQTMTRDVIDDYEEYVDLCVKNKKQPFSKPRFKEYIDFLKDYKPQEQNKFTPVDDGDLPF